jgi:trimeric autotransporter adhesin
MVLRAVRLFRPLLKKIFARACRLSPAVSDFLSRKQELSSFSPFLRGSENLTATLRRSMTTIARSVLSICLTAASLCALAAAQSVNSPQTSVPSQASAVVPRLVNFSGKAIDADGKIVSGTAGAAFAIYSEQSGGAPLWMETQNVTADAKGNYTVQLGATKPEGLPLDLFASGEARWLGVRINGGEEGQRVLLLSVPYALKAADAETVGGLPASAFMLAGAAHAATQINIAASAQSSNPAVSSDVTTSGGTVNTLPLFTTATNVQSSILTQTGSGTTGRIGLNTTSPASTLDVNGVETVRGNLSLPATGAATTSGGRNSQPLSFIASSYNSGTAAAVNQNFRWQAEPAANDTAAPTGTLNLLYSSGTNTLAETGLKINNKGLITFAAGQTFPGGGGGGGGSVTSVGLSAPASDFTVSGSPVTTSGTLALNWNTAPTSSDVASTIVKRDPTGSFSAGSITATSTASGGTAVSASAGSSTSSNGVIASGATGVAAYATVAGSIALYGDAGNSTGSNGVVAYGATGVAGTSTISNGTGVYGSGGTYGVYGTTSSGYGVYGTVPSSGADAVHGVTASGGAGVSGINDGGSGGWGVYGEGENSGGVGGGFYNTSTGDALFAENQASGSFAAFFLGNVDVDGTLSKAGGSFKIDDPIDPANKYLYHSFVESPDMMNIYNGNVTTDAEGNAVVQLPEWFESLNRDFRYQLTVLGQFAQAIVAGKVANHQFAIKTDKPNVEVSWQVTGVRQDAWANAHRIPVEVEKAAADRGLYLHPELFGAPAERSIAFAHHPMMLKTHKQAAAAAPAVPTATKRLDVKR